MGLCGGLASCWIPVCCCLHCTAVMAQPATCEPGSKHLQFPQPVVRVHLWCGSIARLHERSQALMNCPAFACFKTFLAGAGGLYLQL